MVAPSQPVSKNLLLWTRKSWNSILGILMREIKFQYLNSYYGKLLCKREKRVLFVVWMVCSRFAFCRVFPVGKYAKKNAFRLEYYCSSFSNKTVLSSTLPKTSKPKWTHNNNNKSSGRDFITAHDHDSCTNISFIKIGLCANAFGSVYNQWQFAK